MHKLVAILWQDHFTVSRAELPLDINKFMIPTLSVGLILDETKKYLTLASNIERHGAGTSGDCLVIFKSSILSIKEYGEIEVNIEE